MQKKLPMAGMQL